MEKQKFKNVVLDLGCGKGLKLANRAKKSPNTFFIGIDNDITDIKNAKLRYGYHPNIAFIHADATQLPIKKEKVVGVTADFLLHTFRQIGYDAEGKIVEIKRDFPEKELVGEIKRVLKKGRACRVTDSPIEIVEKTHEEFIKQGFKPRKKSYFGLFSAKYREPRRKGRRV